MDDTTNIRGGEGRNRSSGDGPGTLGDPGAGSMGDSGDGDRLLMREVASGDEIAFSRLVDAHHAVVLNTCYRILGNREDAEDVALDVLVRARKSSAGFRGDSKLSTWLYRISVNLSLNYLRKRRLDRYLGFLSLSEPAGERAARGAEAPENSRPDRQFEAGERSRVLNDALTALPDNQRAAIVLHKFEGLSQDEIAGVLGVTPAAVESLVHRAKQALSKRLLRALGGS